MPRIALLHAQRDLAEALADTIERIDPTYEVDVFSQSQTIPSRVKRGLSGDYDLLQADEMVRNGVLGAIEKRRHGTPLVVCIRGWDDYTNAHGHHSWLEHHSIKLRSKFVLHHADCTLFVSSVCREAMRRYYSIGSNRIVDRPFEVSRFQNADPENASNDDCGTRILTVTNFRYRQKARGVITTLDGLQSILDQNEHIRYAIAGDGREFDTVAQHVESYPHRDQVDLLGYREDIPDLLANADLFVYVSYLDALPMAVLEAQAAGLPIIGGTTSGVPEAVGTAGRLCPPTPEDIETAVDDLLSDPEGLSDLAELSHQKMFNYNERAAQRYLDVWTNILH
jgi:glycosyltransferase involved in cell wall biosynthesis